MSGWAKLDIAIGEWWNRTATPCTVASSPNNIVLHNFPGFVDQERHSHRNGPLLGSNTCATALVMATRRRRTRIDNGFAAE